MGFYEDDRIRHKNQGSTSKTGFDKITFENVNPLEIMGKLAEIGYNIRVLEDNTIIVSKP